jgi:hypothetical protein
MKYYLYKGDPAPADVRRRHDRDQIRDHEQTRRLLDGPGGQRPGDPRERYRHAAVERSSERQAKPTAQTLTFDLKRLTSPLCITGEP